MRIKRYLGLFLVALVSVFALGLANKDVKAETVWDYHETFDLMSEVKSYSDGSFTTENGVVWSYVHARNEDGYGIDGTGLLLRRSDEPSSVTATFTNGVGEFMFEYRKAYTGNTERKYNVEVTHNEKTVTHEIPRFGTDPGGADETVHTFQKVLNLSGEVTIKIYATGAKGNQQVTFDNFKWTEHSSEITANVNQLFGPENEISVPNLTAEFGNDVVVPVTESGDNVFQFALVNGVIRNDFKVGDNTLPITEELDVLLVYATEDTHAVLFLDSNGKLIENTWVVDGENVLAPPTEDLSKPGYKLSETPWLSNEGVESLENITSSRVYRLQYELEETSKVNITVGETTTEHNFNDIVTLTATKEEFKAWVDTEGNVLSTNKTFKFTALTDRTVNESTEVTLPIDPIITMTNDLGLREGMQSFLGQLQLRDGDTLVEHGLVVTKDGLLRDEVLTLTNGTKAKSNVLVPATNEFLLSIGEDYLVVRAFVTVRNAEGIIETFYSNNQYNDVAIVTFNTDGGNEIDPVAIKVGTTVQKPADPERPSHEFLGWFVGETAFDFATLINEDTIITAKWEEKLPTILEVRALALDTETEFVGIVTGIDGDNLFVQDETAAIYLYNANLPEGLKVGDEVRVQGTRADFNGLKQIDYGATVTIETVGDETFPIHNFTNIADLTNDLQSQRFNLENLVIVSQSARELILTDGVDQIVLYTPAFGTIYNHIQQAEEGHKVDIVGAFIGWRYDNPQITIIDESQLVFLEPTDLDKVTLAAEELTIAGVAGAEGITLPTTGLYGVNITWSSSNTSVISNDGNVTLPTEETTVIMTATISLNTEQTTKTFDVVVHPEGQVVEPVTVTASYTGSTTNMTEENNAETIGLNPLIFYVESVQRETNPLHVGLNKDGQIRLYNSGEGNGNILSIEIAEIYKISKVKFVFGGTVNSALIKSGDNELHNGGLTRNSSLEFDDLDTNLVSIKNIGTGQIYILSIEITYIPN